MDISFLSPLDSFHMKPPVFGSWQFLVVSRISLLEAGSPVSLRRQNAEDPDRSWWALDCLSAWLFDSE